MASFHYRALAANGKMLTGVLASDDVRAVSRELRRQGMTPVFIGTAKPAGFSIQLPTFGRGRRVRDVLHFTQEISTLLTAGIPLDRALQIASELTDRKQFQSVISDVLRSLRGGKAFADSLAGHPEYFPDLYLSMVRAGEVSGTLSVVMDRLAEFERVRDELRGYLVSSLTYPALLSIVGAGSIFVLLKFVIPRFADAFAQSNIEMPLPMQVLLGVSNFVGTWGVPILVLLAVAGLALRSYIKTPAGKLEWDRVRLKIPLLGQALLKADTARFARAMSTLVSNTVPLVQSLAITKGILANRILANAVDEIAKGVKRGEGLAGPLIRTGKFPPLAGHLLSVGEETGHLDHMFERMADIFDRDTRESVKRFTALFEPIVILLMGVIVGAMILSIMLAITSINQIGL